MRHLPPSPFPPLLRKVWGGGNPDGRRPTNSGRRSAYRTVRKESEVDEALFGNTKPGARPDPKGKSQVEMIHKEPSPAPFALDTDKVVLTSSDIRRMAGPSSVLSAEQVATLRKQAEADKEQVRAAANVRKAKMMKMEEERKKQLPKTESEILNQKKDQGTLSRADFLLQEEMDEVKRMNQMVLYSKCVTIRDAQIAEKMYMMKEEEEEERRHDLQYEIERIKGLQAYEEREVKRAADRKVGAKILAQQIKEREADRQRIEELRDQEREQMLKEIERMKVEEIERQTRKKEQGKKLLEEVVQANSAQIERKKLIKAAEAEEDRRIALYIKERDAKEQRLLEEKEAIAKEKEKEIARLRAQQEKAADKQAELDELRARRAQEAYEREWRENERRSQERAIAINKDMAEAREAQKQHKLKQLAVQAKMEEEEFYRIIAANRMKEKEDSQLAAKQMAIRKKHKEDLIAQIAAIEEKREVAKKEYRAEGDRMRREHAMEKAKLESIKQRKLDELLAAGVPAKYRAELERKRIG